MLNIVSTGHTTTACMARHIPHLWFPQHLCQSSHLRSSLRGLQVVIEEDAEEEQCFNHGNGTKHLTRLWVGTTGLQLATRYCMTINRSISLDFYGGLSCKSYC